jgi:hypothetical protein
MLVNSPHNFEYAGDLCHVSGPGVVREFDIAANTVVDPGEMVTLLAGKVVNVTDMTKAVLGIAAEPHDGVTDDRQKGTKIKVYCSPTAMFKCRPNVVAVADSGSATTFVDATLNALPDDVIIGGYLKIVSSAALTKTAGALIEITDFTGATGTVTGVFTGGVTAGDKAIVLPPVGAYCFNLTSDGLNLDLTSDSKTALRIVKVDKDTEEVYVAARLHVFGNNVVATA